MRDAERVAGVFKLLSTGTRVRMVQLLKKRPLCVNALARQLGITPAAVSQHLRVLRDAGLVAAERKGYFVHYRASPQALKRCGALAARLLGE